MPFEFTKATSNDVDRFARISVSTFRETFESVNNPDDFQKYLSEAFHPTRLTRLLNDSDYHVWLLWVEQELAGYFTLRTRRTPPIKEIRGAYPVEIERFYIDSQYQGQGFGHQMMLFCLEQAEHLGADIVWLGVWDKNEKAQRFYYAHDFTTVGRHDYWLGNDCQNDLLMIKPVTPDPC